MKIPEGLSCQVTPEQAYPKGVPDVPSGWEFVRFGNVLPGNVWLSCPEGHPINLGPEAAATTGPRIIVRRKPEPKPKPAECKWSGGGHCPCTDKCCFCHYEEKLPSKPTRERRFEFLDSSGILNTNSLYWNVPQELLREVKPITQEQITKALSPIYCVAMERVKYVNFLRNLGIEVED